MISFIRIVVLIIIFSLIIYTNTLSVCIYMLFFLKIILILKKKYSLECYGELLINTYLLYSLIGVINYTIYYFFCGQTFAPYGDDSYYFMNIIKLLSFKELQSFTLYEYIMFFFAKIISFIMPIYHYQLLPINWFIASLTVVEAIKFANLVLPVNHVKQIYFSSLLIILNSSYIDGSVHLYRDSFMCLFLILSLRFTYEYRIRNSILFAVLTGFIRGANGFIVLLYIALTKCIHSVRLSRTGLWMMLSFILLLSVFFSKSIDYESYMRGFVGSAGRQTISERLTNFKEQNSDGLTMTLIKSNNPFLNACALPVFMVSPFKIRDFFISEYYSIRSSGSKYVTRFRIESVWELVMIFFYSTMVFRLFMGIYYWLKDTDVSRQLLLFIFILMIASVTYVSMQSRHKMMFVLLYPLVYNYYYLKSSIFIKRISNYIAVLLFFCSLYYSFII